MAQDEEAGLRLIQMLVSFPLQNIFFLYSLSIRRPVYFHLEWAFKVPSQGYFSLIVCHGMMMVQDLVLLSCLTSVKWLHHIDDTIMLTSECFTDLQIYRSSIQGAIDTLPSKFSVLILCLLYWSHSQPAPCC